MYDFVLGRMQPAGRGSDLLVDDLRDHRSSVL